VPSNPELRVLNNDFQRPHQVQFKGHALAGWLLKQRGWQLSFEGLPARQGMFIMYPHTSNWDFVVLLLMKWATGIQVSFWAKDSLFKWPVLRSWMRWIGGVPVRRTSAQGMVGDAVAMFQQAKQQDALLWLALAPEGTRKHIPGWRSGFYRTTCGAQVPLCLVKLDYLHKTIRVTDFIRLTGDETADFACLSGHYDAVNGKYPANASPIRLLGSDVSRAETIN
jgi:1-acyl-sn-glycerol-3-phosphate acyltransferase